MSFSYPSTDSNLHEKNELYLRKSSVNTIPGNQISSLASDWPDENRMAAAHPVVKSVDDQSAPCVNSASTVRS